MKRGKLVSVALGLLLAATAGAEQAEAGTSLVLDAKTRQFLRCVGDSCSPTKPPFLNASDTLTIEIRKARCGSQFRVEVTERALPELEASVRGLDKAAGLVSVLPAPRTLGAAGDTQATVPLPEVLPLVDRLSSIGGAVAVRLEIVEDQRRLGLALQEIKRRRNDYDQHVCQMTRLSSCPAPTGGLPEARDLDALEQKIRELNARLEGTATTCRDFADRVNEANGVIRLTKVVRGQIEGPMLGPAAKEIASDLDSLEKRVGTFGDKLARVLEAVTLARQVLETEQSTSQTNEAPLLAIYKQWHDAYGDLVTPDFLERLAARYRALRRNDLQLLRTELNQVEADAKAQREANKIRQAETNVARDSVRDAARTFEDRTRRVNDWLRSTLEHLGDTYDALPGEPRRVSIQGPWTTNQALLIRVLEKEQFQRPDVSALAEIAVPAGATAMTTPASPPPPDFAEIGSHRIDAHKTYRFNVGGAIILSGLGEHEFVVRSVPRLAANGTPVVDSDGNPVSDKKIFESSTENHWVDYALTLSLYLPKELDVFPTGKGLQPAFGIMTGVSLRSPTENLYFGGMFQPVLGIQLMAGVHLGRRAAPQLGIVPASTTLPADATEPPLRKEWKTGAFFSLGFDINLFRKLFGGGT